MTTTQATNKAYSFDLEADQAVAWLKLGRTKHQVSVTQYSWAGYTIVVPNAFASNLWLGRKAKLVHQGATYDVTCLTREKCSDDSIQVELKREDDASKLKKLTNKKTKPLSPNVSLNQRDPILGILTWAGLFTLLMTLPGWGDGWGTSQIISEGFRSIFLNACDACKSVYGR